MKLIDALAFAALAAAGGAAQAEVLQANFTVQITSSSPTGPYASLAGTIDGTAVFDDNPANGSLVVQTSTTQAFTFAHGVYLMSIPALELDNPVVGVEVDNNGPVAPDADIFNLGTRQNSLSYFVTVGWPLGQLGGLSIPSPDALNAPYSLSSFAVLDSSLNSVLSGTVTSFHVSAIPEASVSLYLLGGALSVFLGNVARRSLGKAKH